MSIQQGRHWRDVPAIERFEASIARIPECGCWLWTGTSWNGRYGNLTVNGRRRAAHVFAYEHFVGPVPEGMELDHTCRTTFCANPWHLEPVTHKINVLRGRGTAASNARKTHCVKGHSLSGENLRVDSRGKRRCLACHNARCLSAYHRRKANA